MQAQVQYQKMGMTGTFAHVIRTEGVIGLFRGLLPPLLGSSVFRSVQFGVYNYAYSGLGQEQATTWATKPIPGSGGLEARVVIAGVTASTARAIVECPLELIKVRQMTGQPWAVREVFSGFSPLWIRTVGLMTTFFVLIDYSLRYIPDLVNAPLIGPFLKGGVAATVGWAVIWPFENIKNQIQARAPGPQTQFKRLLWVAQEQGVRGLFRGFMPGAARSMVANGVSMLCFDWCQGMRKKYLNK